MGFAHSGVETLASVVVEILPPAHAEQVRLLLARRATLVPLLQEALARKDLACDIEAHFDGTRWWMKYYFR